MYSDDWHNLILTVKASDHLGGGGGGSRVDLFDPY